MYPRTNRSRFFNLLSDNNNVCRDVSNIIYDFVFPKQSLFSFLTNYIDRNIPLYEDCPIEDGPIWIMLEGNMRGFDTMTLNMETISSICINITEMRRTCMSVDFKSDLVFDNNRLRHYFTFRVYTDGDSDSVYIKNILKIKGKSDLTFSISEDAVVWRTM